MVLTDELQTDLYPAATMEIAQTTTEEALYANLNTTRIDKPLTYPVDNTTSPNDKVAKVSAAAGSQKVGPSIILKVMAGDKFNIKVSSWYKTSGATPGTPVSPCRWLHLNTRRNTNNTITKQWRFNTWCNTIFKQSDT